MKNKMMKELIGLSHGIEKAAKAAISRINTLATEKEERGTDDAEILGRFIDEVLNSLMNGRRVKWTTRHYKILDVNAGHSVQLQTTPSGSIWEIPINAHVFQNKHDAAWESFRADRECFLKKFGSKKNFLVYRNYGTWTGERYYDILTTWEEGPHHYIVAGGLTTSFSSISTLPILDHLKDNCFKGWKNFVSTVFPNEGLVVYVRESGDVMISRDLFGTDGYVYYRNPLVVESRYYTHPTDNNTTTAVVDPEAGNLRIYENGRLMRVIDVGSPIVAVANSREAHKILAATNDAVYSIDTGFYTVTKTHDVAGITDEWKVYAVEDGVLKLLVWPDNNGTLEGGERTALLPDDVAEVEVNGNGLLVLRNDGTFITVVD
ncbi:hypothetical protein IKF04_00005 [Candidatus Saccharibacteria bacterium]|nr:hypothetical protein [Candidatus Saccharibacteria bacterium]